MSKSACFAWINQLYTKHAKHNYIKPFDHQHHVGVVAWILKTSPGEKAVKVALWSSPRSCSTVLTKCLSAIGGIEVFLELFSYAAIFRCTTRSLTGREQPRDVAFCGWYAVIEELFLSAQYKKKAARVFPPPPRNK